MPFDTAVQAMMVGIGGTVVLDLYAKIAQLAIGMPATNWRMVGRWIGHMTDSEFVQPKLAEARAVRGEHVIGWIFHYAVGTGYGLLILAIWGSDWLENPDIAAPLVVSLALLVLPYFVMMSGMGLGIAGSRTLRPNLTRLKSLIGHTVFGLGMYFSAVVLVRFA